MKLKLSVLLVLFFATSCVETVIVGAGAGVVLATREKSVVDTKDDVIISTKIDAKFIENGLKTPKNGISVMVNEGRVLLIGVVRSEEKAKLAQSLAWKTVGVKEVIDEVKINEKDLKVTDFTAPVKDSALTSWLKIKLFFKQGIKQVNYKITTMNDAVYLFGIAKNEEELQKVLYVASHTKGVKKVVNHIILASDARRK